MSARYPWSALLVSAILVLGAAGCSKEREGARESSPNHSTANSNPEDNAADRAGVGTQQAPSASRAASADPSTVASAGQPVQLQAPKVEVPRDVYVPTQDEIQRAFADVLAQTILAMPDTPERNQWYQQQANQLQTIKVQQCSGSYAGTASVCNVVFAGRPMQIKIMLTTSGWVLVK